jgi:hypothetical protein
MSFHPRIHPNCCFLSIFASLKCCWPSPHRTTLDSEYGKDVISKYNQHENGGSNCPKGTCKLLRSKRHGHWSNHLARIHS